MLERILSALLGVPFLLGAAAAPDHAGEVLFRFQDPAIVEASALVVTTDGLAITSNDSGDTGRIFAVDPRSGETVGVTHWSDSPVDVEALAPGPRRRHGGATVWVGDIGDNTASRDTVQVALVPIGRGDRTVTPTVYDLAFPDGAHDAETLVRKPIGGRLYVATKGVFGGTLYAAPNRLAPDHVNRLTAVGPVLPIATDGAFFPDGRHLIVRNYTVATIYDFPSLEKVRTLRLPSQPQGEGIAVTQNERLWLDSEGTRSAVLKVSLPRGLLETVDPGYGPGDPMTPTSQSSAAAASGDETSTADHTTDPLTGYRGAVVRLRRTSPDQPGWTRKKAGSGFSYVDQRGERLAAEDVQRVKALAIPPAYRDVWISPFANGHLQAVGTDDAGRRQYLYHPDWRTRRDAAKFDRMLGFGKALVKAREQVVVDLGREGMPLERACAAAVRLLDLGYFRIGNDVYAEDHGSFGLTTLERRHVRRAQDALVFTFVGKSGVEHRIEIDDEVVIATLEVMRKRRTPGDLRLLAYQEKRSWHAVLPELVNTYVRETTGIEATAKDFRTWHATVLAAAALAETPEPGETKASRKRAVSGAMKEVASFLGNTPTLARSSYVDPRVIDAYDAGRTIERATSRRYDSVDLRQAGLERATLKLLKEQA